MTTREITSECLDGSRVVLTQRLLPSGEWHNQSARFPDTMTDLEPATGGLSGSSNSHARKSPSASERWTSCTASIALESANEHLIFPTIYGRTRDLVPYLQSIPAAELFPHEFEAMELVRKIESGKLKIGSLSPDQKKAIRSSESSVYAREGTRAHEFAAAILTGQKTLEDIPEEFREGVGGYVDHCLGLRNGGDEEMFVEAKVTLWYSPKDTGTTDFALIQYGDTPVIFGRDLKWGAGKLVYNQENTQFAIYVRSLIEQWEEDGIASFPPDTVINLAAYQPNHREAQDMKPWILTLADLRAFTKGVEEAAATIDAGTDTVFAPSDETCQWCACKGFCEARKKAATEALDNPNSALDPADLLALLPDDDEHEGVKQAMFRKFDPEKKLRMRLEYVAGLTGEPMEWVMETGTLVRLWNKRKEIISFLEDAGDWLADRVLSGEKIEGLKIVIGNPGNRKWVSEEDAEKLLKQKFKIDQYAPRSVISVAQAEKLLEPLKPSTKFLNLFDKAVTRSPGGKIVVSEDDKREAVVSDLDMLPDDDDGLGEDD